MEISGWDAGHAGSDRTRSSPERPAPQDRHPGSPGRAAPHSSPPLAKQRPAPRDLRCFVYSDRPVYRPGDVCRLRVLGRSTTRDLKGERVGLLLRAEGVEQMRGEAVLNEFGADMLRIIEMREEAFARKCKTEAAAKRAQLLTVVAEEQKP